ncbi:DUF58 domain-containing protein [Kallotenue papyrolyticum]|uniref:DUF58 domain-containing protein n=1 Tax=Kallotenue papyrolyticum TaxID=1325125 RepID=UPI000492BAEE|nr:DUF58 domain-containing protein [Kallotenue papyrolyticum]
MSTPSTSNRLFEPEFLAKLDRLALIARRAVAGELQGERRSPRRGASVEFADFKPYVAGDDFRQIDWNLYARLERFFLKLFVAEEELTIHLLVDTSRSMDYGEPNKLWYAKRAAGALGYIALANLDRVTLAAFGQERELKLPPQRSRRGVWPLFAFLSDLQPGAATHFAAFCQRYAQTARQAGPLLLCSDLLDEQWQDGLRALLSRRFEITLLHILAPQELDPQIEGDVRLIDAEGGPPVDLTADLDLLQRYRRNLEAWRDEIAAYCATRDIGYVPIATTDALEELLFDLLRRRGLLR